MYPGAGAAIQPASKSVATGLDEGTGFNPGPGRNDVTIDLEKLDQNFDTTTDPDPRVIPSRNGAASVSVVSKSIRVITTPGFGLTQVMWLPTKRLDGWLISINGWLSGWLVSGSS